MTSLCPWCGRRFPVTPAMRGQLIACPHCAKPLKFNPFGERHGWVSCDDTFTATSAKSSHRTLDDPSADFFAGRSS